MEREARKVQEKEYADNTEKIALSNEERSEDNKHNSGNKENQMQCRKQHPTRDAPPRGDPHWGV